MSFGEGEKGGSWVVFFFYIKWAGGIGGVLVRGAFDQGSQLDGKIGWTLKVFFDGRKGGQDTATYDDTHRKISVFLSTSFFEIAKLPT